MRKLLALLLCALVHAQAATYTCVAFDNQGNTSTSINDGVTWSAGSSTGAGGCGANAIAVYGDSLFVVATGCSVRTTPDAVSWTLTSTPGGGNSSQGFIFSNSQFVSTGFNMYVDTSPTTATWTNRATLASGGVKGYALCNDGSTTWIVAGEGSGGNNFSRSTDNAVTWGAVAAIGGGSPTIAACGYGSGPALFVAVSNDNSANIFSSPTGVTWTARTDPYALFIPDGIVYVASSGTYVINGAPNDGTGHEGFLTSTDGVSWTSVTTTIPGVPGGTAIPLAKPKNAFVTNANTVIAPAGAGHVGRSTNSGSTWTDITTTLTNDVWALSCGLAAPVPPAGFGKSSSFVF